MNERTAEAVFKKQNLHAGLEHSSYSCRLLVMYCVILFCSWRVRLYPKPPWPWHFPLHPTQPALAQAVSYAR